MAMLTDTPRVAFIASKSDRHLFAEVKQGPALAKFAQNEEIQCFTAPTSACRGRHGGAIVNDEGNSKEFLLQRPNALRGQVVFYLVALRKAHGLAESDWAADNHCLCDQACPLVLWDRHLLGWCLDD